MNSQPVYNLHYFQLHVRCSRSLRPPTLYKQLQAAISLAITIFPVTLINADGKIHNPILQEHTTASLAAFIVKWIKLNYMKVKSYKRPNTESGSMYFLKFPITNSSVHILV